MKENFEEIKVDIVLFEVEDVITTSGFSGNIGDNGYEDGEL